MYAVLAAWVIVLAGVLDRLLYVGLRLMRRPLATAKRLALGDGLVEARLRFTRERRRAERSLARIDAMSQLATSIGLFGTVLGITQAFFARGGAGLAAPEVLSAGLATALYTTLAGLMVFLFGQGFLIVYGEWVTWNERHLVELLDQGGPS